MAQRRSGLFMVPIYISGGNPSIDSPAGPTGLLAYDLNNQTNKQTNKQINKSLDNERASGGAHMAEGVLLCFYVCTSTGQRGSFCLLYKMIEFLYEYD